MHDRHHSDLLAAALSVLVLIIMGVAVGVSSHETPPPRAPDTAEVRAPALSNAGTSSLPRSPSAELL